MESAAFFPHYSELDKIIAYGILGGVPCYLDAFDGLGEEKSAEEIFAPENINRYMGHIFEKICLEYMLRRARRGQLPFVPEKYGRWWGNNPSRRMQDDIDVLLSDRNDEKLIMCECKFRNELFGKEEFENMISRRSIFPAAKKVFFFAFSKSGFSASVREKADSNAVTLIEIQDMFTL